MLVLFSIIFKKLYKRRKRKRSKESPLKIMSPFLAVFFAQGNETNPKPRHRLGRQLTHEGGRRWKTQN